MYEGKDKSFYICEYEHADLVLIPEIFEHDRVTGGGENANVTEIFRDSGTILRIGSSGRNTSLAGDNK